MSTRSRIAIETADGYRSIYCHSDGMPGRNGVILRDHYRTVPKIARLLALGDLSSLGAAIGERHPFGPETYAAPDVSAHFRRYGHMCTAFGRDRGEQGVGAADHRNFADLVAVAEDCNAEWLYLWREGRWHVAPIRRRLRRCQMTPLSPVSGRSEGKSWDAQDTARHHPSRPHQ